MKGYRSKRKNSIDKRVRKVHRKAKAVGLLYLLGAVLLLATALLLPVLSIDGKPFAIDNFYQPLMQIVSADRSLPLIVASVSYALLLLVTLVNVFKCLAKLGWLTKRSYRYANGYNRNMRAMDDMGKAFSSSLAAVVILNLQAYLLQAAGTVELIQMNAYIILGAGLVVHFIAGLIGGKVSRFYVGETGVVEEEKRTCGLFTYFFRNLVQLAATAAIVYFLADNNQMYLIFDIVTDLTKGAMDMNALIVVGLQLLTLIWLFVLVKHSTAATEFNLWGIEGRGMCNFRVFSFFTVITAIGLAVWTYLDSNAFNLGYAVIAGAAFVAFLLDCIVKSRPKDDEDEMYANAAMQPNNGFRPVPGGQNIYLQLPGQQTPVQMPMQPQTAYQPIYVPVYYPYPQPQPQPQPQIHHVPTPVPMYMPVQQPAPVQAPVAQTAPTPQTFTRPEPTPAPEHLKPAPSPMVAKEEAALAAQTEEPKTKKALYAERKELKARKEELKREKEQSKRTARMAKKNKKVDEKTAKMAAQLVARREAAMNNAAMSVGAIGSAAAVTALAANAPETGEVVTPVAPVMEVMPVAPVVAPSVSVNEVPAAIKQETPAHFDGEVNELPSTLDPKKDWKVRCPRCGKELNVKDSTPYHRCPSCSKVFTIRKFETYTKKD